VDREYNFSMGNTFVVIVWIFRPDASEDGRFRPSRPKDLGLCV
jgi:hypothetical protein